MHIPDGFIEAPTSIGAAAVSAGGLAVSLRRSAEVLEDKVAPMAGLVAAYVFAVQMLNFPVAGGTSGHLLGGALAAVLVGPWVGSLCIAVVLAVQALLFADGGLSALGLNVLNMAIVGVFAGYGVFLLARRLLPATGTGVAVASGVAGLVSVVLAALAFAAEYALDGAGGASPGRVFAAMGGVHLLIGVGEAVITAMTVRAVVAVRPDLVHGAAHLVPVPQLDPPRVPVEDAA
ncbi:MAG TPA: energy-coupling factor ABC transporter permease [Acidimicrobiales bacterium]